MSFLRNRDYAYVTKTTGKISAVWICRILFFSCFFVAIFFANTLWKNEAAWIGYLHQSSFLEMARGFKTDITYFLYLVFYRLPIWILLVLFGKCLFGILIAHMYAAWQGFAIGFMLAVCFMRYGAVGILIFMLSGCPHMFVYFFAYLLLYRMLWNPFSKKRILLGSTLFIVGIFLESYVNVLFLEKIAVILAGI